MFSLLKNAKMLVCLQFNITVGTHLEYHSTKF